MANEKFTQLPTVASALSTDIIAAVQGGISVQETLSQVAVLMRNQTVLNYPGDPNGNLAGTVYQLCWDTVNLVLYVCTTTGTSSTAVWTLAGSVSFPISLAQGGTGASLTASNGGIFYSTATAGAILSGTATAGQILRSGSSAAPSWSTATYPATTTVSQLLYSSSANVVGGLATANSAVLTTNSTGVPAWSSSMTNGQILIGSTGATPVTTTITAGAGISITNGAGSITISGGGGGFSWTEVTGTSQAIAVNNGYIANNAGLVTLTLPATAAIGDSFTIVGKGSGGWLVAQNAGQSIHLGSQVTTTGVGGSLASTNRYDCIEVVCITADTEFSVTDGFGNITWV